MTHAAQPARDPLRLDRIVVRHVRIGLKAPFVTAWSAQLQRDVIIVEAYAPGGEPVGYGEAPVLSDPVYNEETVLTAWHVLNDFLVPHLLSGPVDHPANVGRRLRLFHGHAMAKAGLEGAVWDLWARCAGVPLSQLLGGAAARIPAGAVVSVTDDNVALLRQVEARLARGFRRIKLKVHPGRDVDVVRTVRQAFGNIPLAADANGAYSLDHLSTLQQLDEFNLQMLEQPLPWDDLLGHARLQAQLRTPVCLDESVQTVAHARQAIALGSGRVFNLKAGRLGGLSAAVAVHDLCHVQGLPVWCGGLLETGIGRAHNLALASLPGFAMPGDLAPPQDYLVEDVIEPPLTLDAEGYLAVPAGSGIGVAVRRDRLEALTVRLQEHRPADRSRAV